MSQRVADFRSDTVTRPTPRMLEAMVSAKVGDDVLGDDPTVKALEERFAQLFGREAALFMASGTMADQCAVAAHIVPGEEVVVESNSHIFMFEGGGLARVAGAHVRTIAGDNGQIPVDELEAAIRAPDLLQPRTALACLEQTHLYSGGAILPIGYLRTVKELAERKGVAVHIDGARLFNAQAETGIAFSEYGACADSISVSLSKALSCPVGSMLIGSGAFIERARRVRKWLGGGMRQTGYLAACALVALEEVLPLIGQDNHLCRNIGMSILLIDGLEIAQTTTDTNLLFVEVTHPDLDAPMIEAALKERGILVWAFQERLLRFVTHRDVNEADVDRLRIALEEIVKGKK